MRQARHEFNASANNNRPAPLPGPDRLRRTRDCPRVTVRLSSEEHTQLIELADGVSLSVYLRAMALSQNRPRRKRSGMSIEDRAAISQLLGLLGQSRIANNLNQLAYHANVGSLAVDDTTQEHIEDAYRSVLTMRSLLMRGLGLKE